MSFGCVLPLVGASAAAVDVDGCAGDAFEQKMKADYDYDDDDCCDLQLLLLLLSEDIVPLHPLEAGTAGTVEAAGGNGPSQMLATAAVVDCVGVDEHTECFAAPGSAPQPVSSRAWLRLAAMAADCSAVVAQCHQCADSGDDGEDDDAADQRHFETAASSSPHGCRWFLSWFRLFGTCCVNNVSTCKH